MRVGETIATYDVGLALRGKSGKFEVTSHTGDVYDVVCKPSHSASSLEWSSNGNDHPPVLHSQVSEGASPASTKATITGISDEESQTASSPLPLVLEHTADERHSSNLGNIELLYLGHNLGTGQPSSCVYLKGGLPDKAFEGARLLTSRCASFNELDSEIRRLQAQLDEIRSRAKKMFYKAQAFAASA